MINIQFINNIKTVSVLNKLHEQERHFKRELAQLFVYLDTLSILN